MDLDKYLKAPEQFKPDFGWWIDGKTFDVAGNHRNPHDCKDELSLQMGGEFTVETPPNNVPVNFNNREKSLKQAMVLQARSMMNAGMKVSDIKEEFAKHHKASILAACSEELEKQFSLAGSVGRFVLDARGYKNCSEAMKYASKNPFKKHMKYMIGCNCDHHIKQKKYIATSRVSTGDAFGDALQDTGNIGITYETCPKSGMTIMSGQGDIDESWAGDTMIDVMNAGDLSKEDGKKFTASTEQPYIRLKRFFLALDEGNIKKAEEKVDFEKKADDLSTPVLFELDKNAPSAEFEFDKSDNQSVIFGLNPDAVAVVPVDVEMEGGDVIELFQDEPSDVIEVNPMQGMEVSDFDTGIQPSLPVEIPPSDSVSFALDKDSDGVLPVSIGDSEPVIEEISEDPVVGDVGFGTDDDFFKDDGEIVIEEIPVNPEMKIQF